MVESIYFLKPAWCGSHLAGLWPEQGLQPVTWSHRLQAVVCHSCVANNPRMITLASVSFKLNSFESAVMAWALSILMVVVFGSAVVRILKWKIAIGPSAIGF